MKIHLVLTCLAYAFLGFGMAIQQFGIKAGLPIEVVLTIFISSVIFFAIIAFTSLEKVKEKLLEANKDASNKTV